MSVYEGVVYDLDGTLVRLNVDWDVARADTAAALRREGIDDRDQSLWELLERAKSEGFTHLVEHGVAPHERDGARTSSALPASQALPHEVPTGVCSLNCELACQRALEAHEIAEHIDAIVGRDTVEATKPDPEPLLETVDRLNISPENTIFVGDSERDAVTAERAGIDFQYVDEYLESTASL